MLASPEVRIAKLCGLAVGILEFETNTIQMT
jgi:hypothetical protein